MATNLRISSLVPAGLVVEEVKVGAGNVRCDLLDRDRYAGTSADAFWAKSTSMNGW